MPQPPAIVAASFATPPRDAAGRYQTPNRDLSEGESVWHLRVALNVAALGCRGADEATTIAAYNALLASARAPLAGAQAAMAGTVPHPLRRGGAGEGRRRDDAALQFLRPADRPRRFLHRQRRACWRRSAPSSRAASLPTPPPRCRGWRRPSSPSSPPGIRTAPRSRNGRDATPPRARSRRP
ncbi:hypothetical protein AB5I41_20590 [Sphingomonas sp. MMS24-JH45]